LGTGQKAVARLIRVKIHILVSAYEDLADGRRFYEMQADGIGGYFLDSLFSDIDSLKLFGGIHRKVFGFHRMLSKRFPWAVYYRVDAEQVVVFRVLDGRVDPGKIRAALHRS
jgi:plasmid stabilization system protein ParE